jgi:hypothetical protein
MELDPQLQGALVSLGLIILGGLGAGVLWLGKQLPNWVSRAMEVRLAVMEKSITANTALTEATHEKVNGNLIRAKNEATKYRLMYERLERLLQELNKIPEARPFIDQAANARREIEYDAEFDQLKSRLLEGEAPPMLEEPMEN